MEKLNLQLLFDLCKINRPSDKEYRMVTYILNYVYKLEGITIEQDAERNLFITKNTTNPETYPVIVAHMDEVFSSTLSKKIKIEGDYISGYNIINNKRQQCGLGLDDAFGIYCALHLLKRLPNLKVVFTTQEEMGCIGANEAAYNVEFFANVRYMLQADRRGNSDLITHTNGMDVTSDKFLTDIAPLMKKYGYKIARGTMTDVGTLKEEVHVSACNISCGYYKAHTAKEYGKLSELQKCLNFMYDIVTICTEVYPHTAQIPVYNYPVQTYPATTSTNTTPEGFQKYALPCDYCQTFDCARCNLWYQ